jgi:hypothetical protein
MRAQAMKDAGIRVARWVLISYLLTFLAARSLVFLIMTHRIPDLYVYVGQTHVHHLNFGIFLLSGVGAYLLFKRPTGARLRRSAIAYGIGLGLTFDEFGMWFNLGGGYWQRASLDCVASIGGVLGLFAVAPRVKDFRPRHWWTAVGVALALLVFSVLFVSSLRYVDRRIAPRLERLDPQRPSGDKSRGPS